jgi:hypothetical protein
MSTIIATTLSNGSVSVPTATVVNGSAKAWVNLNGTGTIAPRDSMNISGVIDNGTSDYTFSFSNAFSSATYAATGMVGNITGGSAQMLVPGNTPAAGSFRVEAWVYNVTRSDPNFVGAAFHGDLA